MIATSAGPTISETTRDLMTLIGRDPQTARAKLATLEPQVPGLSPVLSAGIVDIDAASAVVTQALNACFAGPVTEAGLENALNIVKSLRRAATLPADSAKPAVTEAIVAAFRAINADLLEAGWVIKNPDKIKDSLRFEQGKLMGSLLMTSPDERISCYLPVVEGRLITEVDGMRVNQGSARILDNGTIVCGLQVHESSEKLVHVIRINQELITQVEVSPGKFKDIQDYALLDLGPDNRPVLLVRVGDSRHESIIGVVGGGKFTELAAVELQTNVTKDESRGSVNVGVSGNQYWQEISWDRKSGEVRINKVAAPDKDTSLFYTLNR